VRAASIVCYFCESAAGTQGIFCGTLRKTFDPVSLYLIAVEMGKNIYVWKYDGSEKASNVFRRIE